MIAWTSRRGTERMPCDVATAAEGASRSVEKNFSTAPSKGLSRGRSEFKTSESRESIRGERRTRALLKRSSKRSDTPSKASSRPPIGVRPCRSPSRGATRRRMQHPDRAAERYPSSPSTDGNEPSSRTADPSRDEAVPPPAPRSHHRPSLDFRRSLTACGLALPPEAFIT